MKNLSIYRLSLIKIPNYIYFRTTSDNMVSFFSKTVIHSSQHQQSLSIKKKINICLSPAFSMNEIINFLQGHNHFCTEKSFLSEDL